jgi:hypothetical protein
MDVHVDHEAWTLWDRPEVLADPVLRHGFTANWSS